MPTSPAPKVYGYNADTTDYSTCLQYLRARYYSTDIQRFVQEDDYKGKFTRPASMNRYIYTEGNPVTGIDPSGYCPDCGNPYCLNGEYCTYISSWEKDANKLRRATESSKVILDGISNILNFAADEGHQTSKMMNQYIEARTSYKETLLNEINYLEKTWEYLYEMKVYTTGADCEKFTALQHKIWLSYGNAIDEYNKNFNANQKRANTEYIPNFTGFDKDRHAPIEYTHNSNLEARCAGTREYYKLAGDFVTCIDSYNTMFGMSQAVRIWNRLLNNLKDYKYEEFSYAKEMLYQVLFNEKIGTSNTFDLMLQFALQFTGEEGLEAGMFEDKITTMKKDRNGNYSIGEFDVPP